MPVPVPCPQCGKTLKLLENMLGKTIRCPSCKQTFKAPPPAPPDDIAEVVAVEAADLPPPAEDAVPVLEEVRRPQSSGRSSSPARATNPAASARKAPPAKKGWGAGLILGILGGVFLLCAGIGTAAFFVGRAIVNDFKNPPILESQWQSYRPYNGRCSVLIPGSPNYIHGNVAAGSQPNFFKFGSSLDRPQRKFVVAFVHIPSGAGSDYLDRLTREEADFLRSQAGGKAPQEREVTWHGRARELVVELPDKRLVVERIVVIPHGGTMAYILAVEGPELRTDSPEVARYFDSLQIDPTPPSSPQNPTPNPRPRPNPRPKPNPNPSPTPNPNQLKLSGDRLTIHPGGTQRVCSSPDGKTLAAVGEDGMLTFLDMPALTIRTKLPGIINGPVVDMAYSKDSSFLAVAAREDVYVFESATGKLDATLVHHNPVAVAFSPDTQTIAVAVQPPGGGQTEPARRPRGPRPGGRRGSGRDRDQPPPAQQEVKAAPGEIVFWSRKTRMEDGQHLPVPGGVRDLAWSPQGKLAVASGKEVHLLDGTTRQEEKVIPAHTGPITGLAFAPDGRSLVTAGGDRLVKLWSVPEGKMVNAYEFHTNPAGRPAFSPDGSHLATFGGVGDEVVVIWETVSGKPLAQQVIAPAQVQNVSFDKDGQVLAIAVKASPVRMWYTRSLDLVRNLALPQGKATRPGEAASLEGLCPDNELRTVRFSPDGKTLAVSGDSRFMGHLTLFDVGKWTRRTIKTSKANLIFAYSGDGSRIVTAGGGLTDGHVYLRDGATGGLRGDFPTGNGIVRSLAVSTDGKLLAVGFDSAVQPFGQPPLQNATAFVRLWDIADEPKLLGTIEKLPFPLGGLAFSPDGKTLHAAAGLQVWRWRAATREELPPLKGAVAPLAALAIGPDGRVYAAGRDLLIHSWDAEGRHGVPWEGHRLPIWGLSLTGDGQRLASVAEDGTCRVCDTASGETTAITEDKSQQLFSGTATGLPAFSPDGSLLAVGPSPHWVSVLQTSQLKRHEPQPQEVPRKTPSSEPAAVAALSQKSNFFRAPLFTSNDTLLTATSSGPVLRWSWPAGALRGVHQHAGTVDTLLRSRDGKVLALKAWFATIYLRDGDTGKLLGCVRPEYSETDNFASLRCIALSPEGDLLALSVAQKNKYQLIVWDVRAGRQHGVVSLRDAPSALAFSPDGKTLACGLFLGKDYGVALYDPRTLKEGKHLAAQKSWALALAFSPDGKRLATSTSSGQVTMWDVDGDKELWSKGYSQQNASQQSLVFSPDGKWLLAGPSSRRGLLLVDAATGEVRVEVTRRPEPNSPPSFSPDGKLLAVAKRGYSQIVVYDVEKLLAGRP